MSKPRCLYCNRPLRKFRYAGHEGIDPEGVKNYGDYGDGHFCGLRCGFEFALVLADSGRRIQRAGILLDGTPTCKAEVVK